MILEVDSSCSEVQTESLSLHVIQRYPNFSLLTLFPTEGCVCVCFSPPKPISLIMVFFALKTCYFII